MAKYYVVGAGARREITLAQVKAIQSEVQANGSSPTREALLKSAQAGATKETRSPAVRTAAVS